MNQIIIGKFIATSRKAKGLTQKDFKRRFGIKIPENYIKNAKKFAKTNLLIYDDNGIKFTRDGFLISNTLILEILSGIGWNVVKFNI